MWHVIKQEGKQSNNELGLLLVKQVWSCAQYLLFVVGLLSWIIFIAVCVPLIGLDRMLWVIYTGGWFLALGLCLWLLHSVAQYKIQQYQENFQIGSDKKKVNSGSNNHQVKKERQRES